MVKIWAITKRDSGDARECHGIGDIVRPPPCLRPFSGRCDGNRKFPWCTRRHPKSPTEPALLDELRGLWENWNREMLSLPEHLTPPTSNIGEMLR
jgi:hypothetical protein